MNNAQVAHIWANQHVNSKTTATGSNFFFNGSTIWSYGSHFPIARFVDEDTILFTVDSYSSSTARHISHTRNAIPGYKTVFNVPNVLADCKEEHKKNYRDMLDRAAESHGRAKRARSAWNKEYYTNKANALIDMANAYTKYFKLGFRQVQHEQLPGLSEKQQKAYERDIRKALREKKKRIEAERKKVQKDLNDWISGATRICELFYSIRQCLDDYAYLRLRPTDHDTVETSHGAKFPLSHARRVYPIIKKIVESGREFEANGRKIRVGHFQIDKIVADKVDKNNSVIYAGCHKLRFEEIKRFAISAGIEEG